MFQLIPVFVMIRRSWIREISENEVLNAFTDKLISIVNRDTIRISYVMINLLRFVSAEEVPALVIKSMGYLIKMVELIRRVSY